MSAVARALRLAPALQLPNIAPGAPCAVQALAQVDEVGGRCDPRVDVGEDSLGQFL